MKGSNLVASRRRCRLFVLPFCESYVVKQSQLLNSAFLVMKNFNDGMIISIVFKSNIY